MNKTVDSVFEFLSEEGFRPKKDDESISLKYEGDTYLLFFSKERENYCSINLFVSFDLEGLDMLKIYELLNKVNAEYVLGKGTLRFDDGAVLRWQADSYETMESFKENFELYITILQQMGSEFGEGYQKLSV